jgi:hypothetical protein
MLQTVFHDRVNILRRTDSDSASRDAFNNPVYGSPESWDPVYEDISLRLSFSGKDLKVSSTGELIKPQGTGYCNRDVILSSMDRIIIVSSPGAPAGTEYVINSVWASYRMNGVVDHYEFSYTLPIV